MKLNTALALGRVSNLPTVWSNVLVGVVLAGGVQNIISMIVILFSMSLIYTAGMFFNDMFDFCFDKQHRPNRPLPSGAASLVEVKFLGSAMMLLSMVLLLINSWMFDFQNLISINAGLILCGLILLYDWRHKDNPFGPLIMGACRGMVYITSALSMGADISVQLILFSVLITAWVLALTMVAKKKNILLGFIFLVVSINSILLIGLSGPLNIIEYVILSIVSLFVIYWFVYRIKYGEFINPVTLLIASICLLDALVILSIVGTLNLMVIVAASLFVLTLLFQKHISGS